MVVHSCEVIVTSLLLVDLLLGTASGHVDPEWPAAIAARRDQTYQRTERPEGGGSDVSDGVNFCWNIVAKGEVWTRGLVDSGQDGQRGPADPERDDFTRRGHPITCGSAAEAPVRFARSVQVRRRKEECDYAGYDAAGMAALAALAPCCCVQEYPLDESLIRLRWRTESRSDTARAGCGHRTETDRSSVMRGG
jgi:hypothetical protein